MRRERLYSVLQGAHISEKANMIADRENCFTFRVLKDANVGEIKEAARVRRKMASQRSVKVAQKVVPYEWQWDGGRAGFQEDAGFDQGAYHVSDGGRA